MHFLANYAIAQPRFGVRRVTTENHQFLRLLGSDGTWDRFEANWRAQCENFSEDFEQFSPSSLEVLRAEALSPTKDTGIYALLSEGGNFDAVVMGNSVYIPGYQEKVLRIRHLLLSPFFDFGDYGIETYSKVLSRMVARTISLAMGDMPSPHIKFHLRSPGDREFFAVAAEVFQNLDDFYDVAIRGAWLHMSIRQHAVD